MARHSGINTTWSIFIRFKGYIILTMHALMHISNGKGTESIYLSTFCNLVEQILLLLNPLTTLSLSPTSCEVIQELAEMFVHRQKTSLELQNTPVCPQHHQTVLHLHSLRITPVLWHNSVHQPWWKNRSGTTESIKFRKVLRVVIIDTTVFHMVVMWLPLLSNVWVTEFRVRFTYFVKTKLISIWQRTQRDKGRMRFYMDFFFCIWCHRLTKRRADLFLSAPRLCCREQICCRNNLWHSFGAISKLSATVLQRCHLVMQCACSLPLRIPLLA